MNSTEEMQYCTVLYMRIIRHVNSIRHFFRFLKMLNSEFFIILNFVSELAIKFLAHIYLYLITILMIVLHFF